MKKFCMSVLLFVSILNLSEMGYTNGILYSPNQSADYVRMPSRNASTDGDAVFYNPAGVTEFMDGFTFYASNQIILQTREANDDSASPATAGVKLQNKYEADGDSYFFPNLFAVYKKDHGAVFFTLGPIGGTGSVNYEEGLPSFYWATINKIITNYGAGALPLLTSLDLSFEGASSCIMGQVGVAYKITDMVSLSLAGRYVYSKEEYKGHVNATVGGTPSTSALDTELTGDCFGAAAGINIRLMPEMNIAARYEWFSELETKADTKKDDFNMFPDGSKRKNTIPQIIGIGVGYKLLPKLITQLSLNYILNAELDYDGQEDNFRNSIDAGIGFEYIINPTIKVSTGYLYSQGGREKDGNSETTQLLDYHSIGIGGVYGINSQIELSLGYNHTFYIDEKIDSKSGAGSVTLKRDTDQFGLGITFKGL